MFYGSIPVGLVYALIAYFLAFIVITGVLYLWQTSRRKERPPERFKLLRGPGETQRRRVQNADENLFLYLFGGAFIPLLIAWLVLAALASYFPRRFVFVAAVIALALYVLSTTCAVIVLFRFLRRR